VIAPDLRGHGLSPHGDSYRYADYAGDLLSLLDDLGLERAAVVGHSLGGRWFCSLRRTAIPSPSIEPAGGGWRFRWDRRVLDTEPVDPFAFLSDVRCDVRVTAGSDSEVMPPTRPVSRNREASDRRRRSPVYRRARALSGGAGDDDSGARARLANDSEPAKFSRVPAGNFG